MTNPTFIQIDLVNLCKPEIFLFIRASIRENYKVTDVATPEAWARDPELVLRFYNERRMQIRAVQPNKAHLALVKLEKHFNVNIIKQNIDDLHERAGSLEILHLHGEINLAAVLMKTSSIILLMLK